MNAAKTLRYMGSTVELGSLLSHYRKQAWRNPLEAKFWRTRAHAMIAEYRHQLAQFQERIAA